MIPADVKRRQVKTMHGRQPISLTRRTGKSARRCLPWWLPALVFFALLVTGAGRSWAAEDEKDLHHRAVELARAGQVEEALGMLKRLHEADPGNIRVTYDYLVVLGWGGRDAEALRLAAQVEMNRAPVYVLEALAKSCRNVARYEEAAATYRTALDRFPGRRSLRVGLALTLADAGQPEAALSLLEPLAQEFPADVEILLALGYAQEAAADFFAALRCYDRVLELDPENAAARRRRILALEALGASCLAGDLAEGNPGILSAEERLRLRISQAALRVRWGKLPPGDPKERFADTDRALRLLDEILASPHISSPAVQRHGLRARTDRLVALRDRGRMAEVVAEYERLGREKADLPYYALIAVGDAYLNLERPEEARTLYYRALDQRPGHFDALLPLVYAHVELEDFPRAMTLADHLNRSQPVWLDQERSNPPRPNPEKLQAELAAALVRAFEGDLREAAARLEAMHQKAPNNSDISRELGNVYASRGWFRKAEKTYELGLALDRRHQGLQMGLAQSRLDLGDYRAAEQAIGRLYRLYPEDREVRRLHRLWQVHNMHELVVEASQGESSGTEFGSREIVLGSTLFSRPFLYHFRTFVSAFLYQADFPEGVENYRRFGLGLEYRRRGLAGQVELTFNQDDGDDWGARLESVWHPDDHWSFPLSLELFSRETPLRALKNGITADAARLGAVFRASELRRAGLSLQYLDFSDGNSRYVFAGELSQRAVTRPHYRMNALLDLYASTNQKTAVPYYSPEYDAAAALTLENTWRLWRRYSRSFSHRIAPTIGGYWQDGFDFDWTAGVLYEHLWEADHRLDLSYGLSRSRRVFDGDPDYLTLYYLRLNWRF